MLLYLNETFHIFDSFMNMKEKRLEKNITLDALAKDTKINKGQLSRIERGLVDPRVSTLEKIAKGLKIELVIEFK